MRLSFDDLHKLVSEAQRCFRMYEAEVGVASPKKHQYREQAFNRLAIVNAATSIYIAEARDRSSKQ